MISPAQARRERALLLRDLHRDQRRRFLRRLAELRAEEKAARVGRRVELTHARDRCVTRSEDVQREAAAAYKRAVELAKLAKLAARQVARDQCALERQHARDEGAHKIEHAKREREEERRFAAELVRLEKGAKASESERRQRQRTRRGERRAESDDEVRGNLEPELVPLFELLKRTIKGSDRQSRTEAFRQYAEEHQAEVYEAQDREADRALRRDVRKHRAEGGAAPRAPARAARAPDELPASAFVAPRRARSARGPLSAVPF